MIWDDSTRPVCWDLRMEITINGDTHRINPGENVPRSSSGSGSILISLPWN